MADNKDWLTILEDATSYRDLQTVFSQMAAEVNSTNDATAIATKIDEAIRRIEQERARDDTELHSATTEYDEFKSQQSGVIGWFKRKLPFTETRKQELQHRGSVNDQKAEVLADNFVIARAQMLKESILPSYSRRMGARPNEWRDSLLRHASIQDIRKYGNLVYELGNVLTQARQFIESVRLEIDAFSEAIFSDKVDRSQRDADILTARNEAKCLEDENRNKEGQRKSALTKLATLVHDEMVAHDPTFKTLSTRTDQLLGMSEPFASVTKVVEEYRDILGTVCNTLKELEAIPAKRDDVNNTMRKLQRDFEDSEYRKTRAANDLREPSSQFEMAARELSNAKVAMETAKRICDAQLGDQNKAEVSSSFEFEESSSVTSEYDRLKVAWNRAEENSRRVAPLFENAKRHLDQAIKETDSIRSKLEEARNEISSLGDKESQLRKQHQAARDNLLRVERTFQSEVSNYASRLQGISWLENFRYLVGVPMETTQNSFSRDILPDSVHSSSQSPANQSRDVNEFQAKLEIISRLVQTLKSDKAIVDKELAKLITARKSALQNRCELLLDGNISCELQFS